MITVSVPGKVHLMGEHAVVFGRPALLATVNLRLSVSVEAHDRQQIVSSESPDYVQYALSFLSKTYKLPRVPDIRVTIVSDIPAGYHLGSSAAVAVGVAGAFTYFVKKLWNPVAINQLAYEIEKQKHGNPSGGDNTAVTMGGFIWYRRELEFLKSIWQLPFVPDRSLEHFFLINTGAPRETTGEMVDFVRQAMEKNEHVLEAVMNENERQTKNVAIALKTGDEALLMDAIRKGHRTLVAMGVVSQKVQGLIERIEKIGGAAKILGGGGKTDGVGFVLCYHKQPEAIDALLSQYGYARQDILLGGDGVRLEAKS